MQERYKTSFLGPFNAFTPGIRFGEDERSHFPPITYSGRLYYTVKSSFFPSLPTSSLSSYLRATENLFLCEFNDSPPLVTFKFSGDFCGLISGLNDFGTVFRDDG